MAFSADGTSWVLVCKLRVFTDPPSRLYCGFENAIEIFDVACSGESGTRLKTTPARSSSDGQKGDYISFVGLALLTGRVGIISTIALSKTRAIFAAGSFSGTIGIYDASAGDSSVIAVLPSSQSGGLTKVFYLFVARAWLKLVTGRIQSNFWFTV